MIPALNDKARRKSLNKALRGKEDSFPVRLIVFPIFVQTNCDAKPRGQLKTGIDATEATGAVAVK